MAFPTTGIPAKCTECGQDLVYEANLMRFYCKHCEEMEMEKKEEKGEKRREAA